MNSEQPVSNQTIHQIELYRKQVMHEQRLREIAVGGKRRAELGNSWNTGPHRSKPTYKHLDKNLKKVQLEAERFDRIEHENRLLLEKMSALMVGSSVLDPTEGTWEFQPGVRLNKNQMPVIDHGISHQPPMPQRGAAREPESLNWGSRRRELERITQENRGIVTRIQGRASYYPSSQWNKRSEEHDQHLMLIRRPVTSNNAMLPAPPSPLFTSSQPMRSSGRRRNRAAMRSPRSADRRSMISVLLNGTKEGDAHLLVGLASGFVTGASVTLEPQTSDEETVIVYETWLRKDGLVLILKEPCKGAHPMGSHVLVEGKLA